MFQFSYAEIMEDDLTLARERERQVLTRSIEYLTAAKETERYGKEAIEAVYYTRRVWLRFIEDLKQPENELSVELRANLISIAIWILKECEQIRKRKSQNYQAIIDVTTIIRDGLK
ncbi:flagellar biosynthesis regulator FlhF [Rhizobium sp. ACO-34A]|nr:flagellar biosynthesis regulator FlaF [Rhizobium sp. ACO-34A]ATN33061.1 flagellar biosynthesis regulator FlhF [Rhizobium sp. ACO-34A]